MKRRSAAGVADNDKAGAKDAEERERGNKKQRKEKAVECYKTNDFEVKNEEAEKKLTGSLKRRSPQERANTTDTREALMKTTQKERRKKRSHKARNRATRRNEERKPQQDEEEEEQQRGQLGENPNWEMKLRRE